MPSVQDAGSPRRRGRVAKGPEVRTGPVGEFAYRLWALKKAAGDPSYDRMRTEFGALASKSALSAAARGHRLPTWETTWEFVRSLEVGVLGQETETVRERWRKEWENAAALCNDNTEPIDVPDRTAIETPAPTPKTVVRSRRLVVLGAIVVGVLAIVSIALLWWLAQSPASGGQELPAPPRDAVTSPTHASDFGERVRLVNKTAALR